MGAHLLEGQVQQIGRDVQAAEGFDGPGHRPAQLGLSLGHLLQGVVVGVKGGELEPMTFLYLVAPTDRFRLWFCDAHTAIISARRAVSQPKVPPDPSIRAGVIADSPGPTPPSAPGPTRAAQRLCAPGAR
ncbi:hypothetical protein GCM10010442_21280 [Kitasatospora kifunensis]